VDHLNPFRLEKDLDFDHIAEERLKEKEQQRQRLHKSVSEKNSA